MGDTDTTASPESLTGALAKLVGVGLAEAAAAYLPALKRMAWDELVALVDLITRRRYDEAKAMVHDQMTAQELADEKELLAGVAAGMADDNAERRAVFAALGMAALKAGLTALLGAAFL